MTTLPYLRCRLTLAAPTCLPHFIEQIRFFAVSLTLSLDNVKTLQKNLRECLKNANKYNRNEIEIIAHWGKEPKGPVTRKEAFVLG